MNARLGFTHRITIDAKQERVWTALTDPVERNNYVCTSNQTDLRAGGAFIEEFAYGPTRAGIFHVVDAPYRLVQENFVFDRGTSHRYYNAFTLNRVERAAGDVTDLVIDVEGYSRNDSEDWLRESMYVGWHVELQVLKAYVETGEDIRSRMWKGVLMGIRFITADPTTDRRAATSGIRIIDVIQGTPAEQAGLQIDDVVTAVDGLPVADFVDFRDQIRKFAPGERAEFSVVRGGSEKRTLPLTFGDAIGARA